MVNKFIKSIEIKKHVILNSFQTLFKKNVLPRSHSFARNDVLLCKKLAITLAEIIIVIFIVGIIAGVFMAMPRKNVGKTDRAKYYVAYDMLKRLQDEQMAENGYTMLNNGSTEGARTFTHAVDTWLNFLEHGNGAVGPLRKARLSNGMVLTWRNIDNTQGDLTASNDDVTLTTRRTIVVDIDGDENYGICDINNQDCHGFILTSDGQVAPTLGDRTDWLTFKVYRFQNNGTPEFLGTNISYNDAITQYCCRNAINGCITASTGNDGTVTVNNITQDSCGGNWNNGGPVFMEAIQPLGK